MVFFLRNVLRTLADITHAQQRAFHLAVHHERLVGRRDLRPAALEQRKAQFLLKLLNGPSDRWLRAAEHFPGGGDTARRHDRREGFELTQIHKHALINTQSIRERRTEQIVYVRRSKRESLHAGEECCERQAQPATMTRFRPSCLPR